MSAVAVVYLVDGNYHEYSPTKCNTLSMVNKEATKLYQYLWRFPHHVKYTFF